MRAVLIIVLVLLLVPTWSGDERLPLYDGTPTVRVERVALDADDPARDRVGRLRYLGGVHLTSDDPAFGGFSAMSIVGDRFTLLGDGGLLYAFTMGDDWRPRDERFLALPGGPGSGWMKQDRDSESMAVDPTTGQIWVGFERANAIWRYAPDFARPERSVQLAAMRDWPENGGAETMVRLSDGRFVVLAETARVTGGGRQALMLSGDPTLAGMRVTRFAYIPPEGYKAVDAAELPDGRLLVLNRRLSFGDGWTTIVSVLDLAAVREGARVGSQPIARLAAPVLHDNFEGIAVVREGGATIVWMVSDANGLEPWQRTLLLKFRLE
ncbi:esterase-like activity of phytase family protein [Sphingomonas sp. RS2018]